jgi:hypothetical protein
MAGVAAVLRQQLGMRAALHSLVIVFLLAAKNQKQFLTAAFHH